MTRCPFASTCWLGDVCRSKQDAESAPACYHEVQRKPEAEKAPEQGELFA